MANQQISLSLPEEAIRAMQARVESGEYPSLRGFIVDSIQNRQDQSLDPGYFGGNFETWIGNHRELLLRESEDWESHIPAEEVLARYRDMAAPAKPAA